MLISCWLSGMQLVDTASAIPMCMPAIRSKTERVRFRLRFGMSSLKAQARREVGWRVQT